MIRQVSGLIRLPSDSFHNHSVGFGAGARGWRLTNRKKIMIMASNRTFKWSASRKWWSLHEDEDKQDVATYVSFLCTSVLCPFVPGSPSFFWSCTWKKKKSLITKSSPPCRLWNWQTMEDHSSWSQRAFDLFVSFILLLLLPQNCVCFSFERFEASGYHNGWPLKAPFIFSPHPGLIVSLHEHESPALSGSALCYCRRTHIPPLSANIKHNVDSLKHIFRFQLF